MDAPRGSVELEEAELARLRRRAYGPDADIAGDAVAQARLSELEAAQRRQSTPVVDAAAPIPALVAQRVPVAEPVEWPLSASTSVPQPVDGEFAEHGPAGGSVTGQHHTERPIADSHPIDGPPAAPWWRRRRWLVILGGAIAVLVLIAALLAWMSQLLADGSTPIPTDTSTALPVPDGGAQRYEPDAVRAPGYVLTLESVGAGAVEPKDPHATLNRLGLSADELRQYADFRGLGFWSGESRDGRACLLVAHLVQGLLEGPGGAVCSADGVEPIVDLQLCSGCTAPEVFAGMPTGSIIRFVLKGDHVEVYLYASAADLPQG